MRMDRPLNGVAELLRRQLREAWETPEGTMEDVSPETAHWIPPGIALPIGAAYAHTALFADEVMNCHTGGIDALTGIQGLKEYPF